MLELTRILIFTAITSHLTFPTADDITGELRKLGRGALLYKVEMSCAFLHVEVDPGNYDLLGLELGTHYVDTWDTPSQFFSASAMVSGL